MSQCVFVPDFVFHRSFQLLLYLYAKMSHNHNNSSSSDVKLDLFVKAGQDGTGYGACPICQRLFMIMLYKSRGGEFTFDVTTVNVARPPAAFKKMAKNPPVLVHGDDVFVQHDEIIQHIDECFPTPSLNYTNAYANAVCLEVFSKFSFYIKQVSSTPDSLLGELQRINDHLRKAGTRYLCSDELTHLDCLMLPKLQHIRVAALAFKDLKIPAYMQHLWRYLDNAYKNDIFLQSCPPDREIVFHWKNKQETPSLSKEKEKQYLITEHNLNDTYRSTDVPA